MLLFYAKSPKMLSDTCCKNFIPFGWQTKKLAFWGGHFCHFPQNFVSTVRHEFLTKWPQTEPLVVSNMTTITFKIWKTIHFKWPALLMHSLATESRVMPHPMDQHHPTRHKTRVNIWASPTTVLRTRLQKRRSHSLYPLSGECRVPVPHQQQKLRIPLSMVP